MKDVGVLLNRKIAAPRSGDSGLPDVARLVVFFRSQGWVAQVLKQKNNLAIKGYLNIARSFGVLLIEFLRCPRFHFEGLSFLACL